MTKSKTGGSFLTHAALLLLAPLGIAPALAQTTGTAQATGTAQTAQGTGAAQGTDGAATSDGAAADQLEEVTVTAERVPENELRTPVSLTELSGQQLAQTNTTSTSDLRGLVPSLEITNQGGGGAGAYGENEMSIFIRGVGDASRFFNNDLGVGVYIDDLYIPTTQNLNLSFYDLQNVQVLNGPQGTLFGRNTLGGAVLLETAPPSNQFGGYAEAGFGSYNRLDTTGAVDLPLTDVLTSRFTFNSSDVDGYITHLLNDQTNDDIHEKSARYQIRFQPTSNFTADLLSEYGENHDDGNEEITVGCNPNAYYVQDYDAVHPGAANAYCTKYAPLGQRYEIYGNSVADFPTPAGSGLNDTGGYTPFDAGVEGTLDLRLAWQLNDNLTLKLISGLRRSDLDSYRDDGTPGGLYTELMDYWNRAYSEEAQAISRLWDGRLNLVAGLYYFHDNSSSIQDTGPDYVDPVGYYFGNELLEKSVAGYLQATLAVTDKFSIIAGVRDTHDEKTSGSNVWEGCTGTYLQEYDTGTGGCWIPGPDKSDLAVASGTWTHTDPRLQLQYQWLPEFMTYLSATSGYLSGGFNAQLPYFPPPPYNLPFQQETVWNYEAGTKGEWLDHRLRVNFDLYDQIFDNIQSGVLEYYNGIDVTTTTSAADAHERGLEAEVDAVPVRNLTLVANYSRLNQGYDAIFPAAQAAGLTKASAITSAPLDQASLSVNYTFLLPNGASLVPSVDWRYVGQEWSGEYPLQYLAPGYALLGAHIQYLDASGKWSVTFWGNNITDKYYYESYANPGVLNTNIGIQQVTPGRPREIGGTFRYNIQ